MSDLQPGTGEDHKRDRQLIELLNELRVAIPGVPRPLARQA